MIYFWCKQKETKRLILFLNFKFLKKVRQLNRNRYEIRVFLTKWHYRLADTFIRSFVFCKRLLAGANLEPTMGILSMRQEYSP